MSFQSLRMLDSGRPETMSAHAQESAASFTDSPDPAGPLAGAALETALFAADPQALSVHGRAESYLSSDAKAGRLDHLRALEAESIHIFREVVAEFERPVMLYSIGKDSSVLLRLAQKAFYPGKIPFPLLHIDTSYKFREMIEFRDRQAAQLGLKLIVHT